MDEREHETGEEGRRGAREALRLLPAVVIAFGLIVIVWIARCRSPAPAPTPPRATPIRYASAPVHLDVRETLRGQATDAAFLRRQIAWFCCLYGHAIVEDPAEAAYTLSVKVDIAPAGEVKFRGLTLEHKYKADLSVQVIRTEGKELIEGFEVSDLVRGASVKERALRVARLGVAELVGKRAFEEGEHLGNPDVHALLVELQFSERENPSFNLIHKELADIGLRAVPDLILALNDTRPVGIPGDFPGLTDESRDAFRVCNFADWTLETILERESPLELDSDRHLRGRVRAGWIKEWRRRCAAFPCPAAGVGGEGS